MMNDNCNKGRLRPACKCLHMCAHIPCLCGLHGSKISNWHITQSCECQYIPFLLESNALIEWYKEVKQNIMYLKIVIRNLRNRSRSCSEVGVNASNIPYRCCSL